jgi:hypothetical protein
MTTTMKTRVLTLALGVLSMVPVAVSAQVAAIPGPCDVGLLPGGARSLVCVPSAGWNGELVVFAHGYVAATRPLNFYNLTLADGTSLPALAQGLGYAFAATSYRKNGLAILEGVEDIRQLTSAFAASHGAPLKTHLTGVSEGGLVAVLASERSPELFTDALSACGPIGNFGAEIDYFGDLRVLFDYFFPGVVPGSPIDIPPVVMANWDTVYVPAITAALAARPDRALALMRTAKAAYDPANPATIVNTTINALWYNVFATNDAAAALGGNPYGNRTRLYFGSSNDALLNRSVQRFSASAAARTALRAYQTTGNLSIPLVTLHTVADEVVPAWHELLYLFKVDPVARGRFIPLPVFRYGHCNFTAAEVAGALGVAVRQP